MAEEVEELGKDGRRKWKGFYANKGLVQREVWASSLCTCAHCKRGDFLLANLWISAGLGSARLALLRLGAVHHSAEFRRKMISEHYATCGKDGATECVKFDFSRE